MKTTTLNDIELRLIQSDGPYRLLSIRYILEDLEAYAPKDEQEERALDTVRRAAKISYRFDVPYKLALESVQSRGLGVEDLARMILPYPNGPVLDRRPNFERDMLFAEWFTEDVLGGKIPLVLMGAVSWAAIYNKIEEVYDIFRIGHKYFSGRIDLIKG